MKKKLLLVVISLVLLMGLQACSTVSTSRQEAVNPGKAVTATGDMIPELTIVVDNSGVISFKGAGGEKIGLCRMPDTKTENADLPVCNVSEKCMIYPSPPISIYLIFFLTKDANCAIYHTINVLSTLIIQLFSFPFPSVLDSRPPPYLTFALVASFNTSLYILCVSFITSCIWSMSWSYSAFIIFLS